MMYSAHVYFLADLYVDTVLVDLSYIHDIPYIYRDDSCFDQDDRRRVFVVWAYLDITTRSSYVAAHARHEGQ